MICYLENQIWLSFFWWRGQGGGLLFSGSVVSDSFQPHGLQHSRLPGPSPSPWACSNSCPLSHWAHSTVSSSVTPFSSCFQPFPASGSFLMSQFFPSGCPSIGASASASILPMNNQGWFPLEWYHLHIWGCWYFSQQSWLELMSHPAQQFTWCTLHRS